MKMTIIAHKSDGAHQLELQAAAKARGIDATIRNLTREDLSSNKLASKLKGAIIWRRSDLDLDSERSSLLPLMEKRTVVSDGIFRYPMLRFKFYQQQILAAEKATSAWSIPTYRFKTRTEFEASIAKGALRLPVIAKPNGGSRGENIHVLQTLEDVSSIAKPLQYVFQNFIPNDCDWRVIVVGGTPVGFLRREAQAGSFLNNISQGASATVEADQALCGELSKIAAKVASLFHLTFCGVDIIRDRETGKLHVLEVNTAPQWRRDQGFVAVTGADVPGLVVDWVVARQTVGKHPLPQVIESYYKDRYDDLLSDAFHFASRLWLWTHDDWARQRLDAKQAEFIGITPEQIDDTIKRLIDLKTKPETVNRRSTHRKQAFLQNPKLPLFNTLLFKVVFCDSVYGLDLRPYIRKYVSDKEFLQAFEDLINDSDSMRLLSTHAVNYCYLLKNYFKDTLSLSSSVLVSPYELLDLLPGYAELERDGVIDHRTSVKLQIYLLTHAIIGESRFYARKVRAAAFRHICKKIEQLIAENYFEVSLDNKLEFLVCASICGYDAGLRPMIEQEAAKSVSWAGNFLVDSQNAFADNPVRHSLRGSEHRNVLYLMSQKEFVGAPMPSTVKAKASPKLIGRLAHASIPAYGVRRAVARVDSGATHSAMGSSNVYEAEDGLHFTLFDPSNHLYTGQEFVTKEFERTTVKNATAFQQRYAVTIEIVVNNKLHRIKATLADRAHMLYPVLLGRNFLSGNYAVDTSKQFVRPKRIVKD